MHFYEVCRISKAFEGVDVRVCGLVVRHAAARKLVQACEIGARRLVFALEINLEEWTIVRLDAKFCRRRLSARCTCNRGKRSVIWIETGRAGIGSDPVRRRRRTAQNNSVIANCHQWIDSLGPKCRREASGGCDGHHQHHRARDVRPMGRLEAKYQTREEAAR
jgi:hypothetical protein